MINFNGKEGPTKEGSQNCVNSQNYNRHDQQFQIKNPDELNLDQIYAEYFKHLNNICNGLMPAEILERLERAMRNFKNFYKSDQNRNDSIINTQNNLIEMLKNILSQMDMDCEDFEVMNNQQLIICRLICYLQMPFEMLTKNLQKQWCERTIRLVHENYTIPRVDDFVQSFHSYIKEIHSGGSESKLELLGQLVIFFHMSENYDQSSARKYKKDIQWKYPIHKKPDSNYVLCLEKRYLTFITENFKKLPYQSYIKWLGSQISFEVRIQKKILRFSQVALADTLYKNVLGKVTDLLLTHPQGPMQMLLNGAYDDLETLLHVVNLEFSNIVKIANEFRQMLRFRANEAFDQVVYNREEVQLIYDKLDNLLDEADKVCTRFSRLTIDSDGFIKAEFIRAKKDALQDIIKQHSFLMEAIQSLLDHQIRQRIDTSKVSQQVGYLVSLNQDKEKFFKKYRELLCYRMIDNCYKYYQKDRDMIENLSRHTFNENTLNHFTTEIYKVLDDVDLSNRITDAVSKTPQFNRLVKGQMQRVVLLIIGEGMIKKNWDLPLRGLDELLERRRFVEPNQTMYFRIPVQQKRKTRSMITHEPPKQCNQSHQISIKSPSCIKDLFMLVNQSLKDIKEHRFLSYPLFSLGYAEVLFRCQNKEYYLLMSTPQMILSLLLDQHGSVSMDDLREVVQNDIRNDVQALLDLEIVVIGNI